MARTELSERVKAEAIAAGWKLRHIRINPPDGTGQLVCQDAYGRTLMLNGTWTMDPLQAGGWNNAATVRINKDYYSYSRRSAVPEEPFPPINPHAIVQAPAEDEDGLTRSLLPLPKSAGFQNKCSIVVEEHDSHHISLPPINPLAIVQAPAEDEDVLTRSLLPLPKSAGFRDNCSIVVEELDSHHISLPPILAIVQAPAEDEDVLTRSKISVLDDNIQASPITAEQVSGGLGAQDTTVFDRVPDPSPFPQDQHGILVNAKSTSDTTLASNMIECGDTFTFNTARSLIFDRALWGPYPSALAEGKPPPEPPPDSEGHANTQMSPSKGAAYFAREGKPPPEPPPDSEGHANTQMSPSKGAAYFARQRSLWDGRKFCSAHLCEKFRGTSSTTFPPSSSSGYRCVVVLAS